MYGWKLNTQVSQWIGGKKVEPEAVRPFLRDGELIAKGHDAVTTAPLGTMVENRRFSTEATAALLRDPNLPA